MLLLEVKCYARARMTTKNGDGEPREVIAAALRLPAAARAALAGALIESLDETIDESAEALWVTEIERRLRELDRGGVRAIPWSQARRAIQGG
jgi:putative addiction module component (TIGR02574 family)